MALFNLGRKKTAPTFLFPASRSHDLLDIFAKIKKLKARMVKLSPLFMFSVITGCLLCNGGLVRKLMTLPQSPLLVAREKETSPEIGTTTCNPRSSPVESKLLLTAVACMYGMDYSLNKLLQRHFHPEVVSCFKYGISTLYFLPLVLRESIDARTVRVGIELGIWCTIYALSLASSIHTTQASKVSFFAALGVVMPPLYDLVANAMHARTLKPSQSSNKVMLNKLSLLQQALRGLLSSPFVGPLLAMRGVYVISRGSGCSAGGESSGGSGSTAPWQEALLLVSPVASSLCYWRSERLAASGAYSPIGATAVMLATVALGMGAFSLAKYGLPRGLFGVVAAWWEQQQHCAVGGGVGLEVGMKGVRWTPVLLQLVADHWRTAVMLLVSSLLVTGWSTVTEQRALRVVSAAEACVVLSLEPFFATMCAALLLGEEVGANTAHAAVYIVGACLWRPIAAWVEGVVFSKEAVAQAS